MSVPWRKWVAVPVVGLAALSTPAPRLVPAAAQPGGHPAARTTEQALPAPTLPRPEDFVGSVTHRYFPLRPGTRWVYRSRTPEGVERISVTVLTERREIEGISATVVHDRATLDGVLVEDTYDWYAQDRVGNVWYLGEDTTSFEPGEPPSHEGSWEAGVGGARAGIAMPAAPVLGEPYRQELLRGEAEDVGVVIDLDGQVHVAGRTYRRVLTTKDTTPLEPDQVELKMYAPGIGQVLELGTSPRLETVRLVRYVAP